MVSLRKHAYSNIFTEKLKIFRQKIKHFSYFCSKHRLWYSLEPPCRGGSNEYPQSMFLSRNKKNNVYPCKPQFYYIKVGLRGSKLYRHGFEMLIIIIFNVWQKTAKSTIRLHWCVSWFGPSLCAYCFKIHFRMLRAILCNRNIYHSFIWRQTILVLMILIKRSLVFL